MNVPHIRDMFPDGDPGQPKFKRIIDPSDIGAAITYVLLLSGLVWFIAGLIQW